MIKLSEKDRKDTLERMVASALNNWQEHVGLGVQVQEVRFIRDPRTGQYDVMALIENDPDYSKE